MLNLLKVIEFFKIFFTLVSVSLPFFKITYLLGHKLKFKSRSQSCDVIFPPKTVKIEKQKTYDRLE